MNLAQPFSLEASSTAYQRARTIETTAARSSMIQNARKTALMEELRREL